MDRRRRGQRRVERRDAAEERAVNDLEGRPGVRRLVNAADAADLLVDRRVLGHNALARVQPDGNEHRAAADLLRLKRDALQQRNSNARLRRRAVPRADDRRADGVGLRGSRGGDRNDHRRGGRPTNRRRRRERQRGAGEDEEPFHLDRAEDGAVLSENVSSGRKPEN